MPPESPPHPSASLLLDLVRSNSETSATLASDVRSMREDLAAFSTRMDTILRDREQADKAAVESSKLRTKLLYALAATVGGLASQGGGAAVDLLRAVLEVTP